MTRIDIMGNEFGSKTKKLYKEKLKEAGMLEILSAFEDEEDEEADKLL